MNETCRGTVLVTGATGYIGGRLVPRLVAAGYRVRCLARTKRKIEERTWAGDPRVEIFVGDVSDEARMVEAMTGCQAAYYLVHSMTTVGQSYAARDHELAQAFASAAQRASVARIIYLGGLGESNEGLSEHLQSRREVERALSSTKVSATVFRAAMIIGAGSASFEILRYLVGRLPVMVTPRWVETESQPIAITNVLHYLVATLDCPETAGATLDIGGADVLSYRKLMSVMAVALGLKPRWVIRVPVLTPRLSSLWIHLITPLSSRIARPLTEGLRNRVICRNDDAACLMPQKLLSAHQSIEMAIGGLRGEHIETSWNDAGPIPGDPDWSGGTVFCDRRELTIEVGPTHCFEAVSRIGGNNGWYAANALWRVRGALDRLVGGPGLRRGRRKPTELAYGDALDFWRVTKLIPNRRLSLRAEMKLPGRALLEFEIEPDTEHTERCTLIQTARFKPRGLLGLLYWFAVLPLHSFVFRGMLNGIRKYAESA